MHLRLANEYFGNKLLNSTTILGYNNFAYIDSCAKHGEKSVRTFILYFNRKKRKLLKKGIQIRYKYKLHSAQITFVKIVGSKEKKIASHYESVRERASKK